MVGKQTYLAEDWPNKAFDYKGAWRRLMVLYWILEGLCQLSSWKFNFIFVFGKWSIDLLKPILKLTGNPHNHPNCGITCSLPNHVRSSPNFQYIFPIIYQHDLWCHRWPLPPSFKSGTLNVPKAPTYAFSAKSSRIFTKISGYLPNPPNFQSGTLNGMSSQPCALLAKSCPILSNFQNKPLTNHKLQLWCSTRHNPSRIQSGTININQAPLKSS